MCGRPIVGHRPPAWAALEDELVADALWDAAGVTRAPSIIVDAARNAVLAASREVDRGVGTVWAADASQRPTGGAEGTRWVRGDLDAEEAFSSLLPFTKRFRVMPFLEGMPFSVMGMVFADAVAALRPVENIVLRSADPPAFRYAGVATGGIRHPTIARTRANPCAESELRCANATAFGGRLPWTESCRSMVSDRQDSTRASVRA